jgi:hypothetical protein
MDRADATGIAGVLIGAGLAIAALTLPWEMSSSLRHVLFWLGVGCVAGGALWLLNVHWLYEFRRVVYLGVPAATIAIIVIVAGYTEWPVHTATPWKHSLEDLYASDFKDLGSSERELEIKIPDPSGGTQEIIVPVRHRLYYDFRGNTDFVSIYIPTMNDIRVNDQIYQLVKVIRSAIMPARNSLHNSVGIGIVGNGVPYLDANDLRFSGKVFIYTAQPLNEIQRGELMAFYRDLGMSLQIYSVDYWLANKDR